MTKDEVKQVNKAIWAAGEWDEIANLIAMAGPKLLDEVPVGPGIEVLDVATGTGGSIAIPAAQRGATVTGSDLAPGSRSLVLWGDSDEVARLLSRLDLSFHVDQVIFTAPSVDAYASFYEKHFGPLVLARQLLGSDWPALRDDVRAFERSGTQQPTAPC
ncbi:class I SAM-dependent methyltransferase [Kribbella sp. VKM Ac-2568]|uniref:class I SAM-dependent methyltransferase n=1 Tax=Kribbella sp. VKM Ac-2568 TaxID=2512219 RepID=UPI001050474F|nr:hypothetical protein [Kribbella sp. VKM Ac-2568]TCM41641.1 hypothetical protein EV648_11114 [Kribbella sp. VKM Ac-2568]